MSHVKYPYVTGSCDMSMTFRHVMTITYNICHIMSMSIDMGHVIGSLGVRVFDMGHVMIMVNHDNNHVITWIIDMSMSMTCHKMCQGSTILTSTCKFHEKSWKFMKNDQFWSIFDHFYDQISLKSTKGRSTCPMSYGHMAIPLPEEEMDFRPYPIQIVSLEALRDKTLGFFGVIFKVFTDTLAPKAHPYGCRILGVISVILT